MARHASKVPFGYEPENEQAGARGSLWVYDGFHDFGMPQLQRVVKWAQLKTIAKLVLYPLHEQTLRRMGMPEAEPYHRRVDRLEALLEQAEPDVDAVIDRWEGRRKKYTPMDTAFRFLAEKYRGPHFVYITGQMANAMASFDTFEEWIKKLRLYIDLESGGSPSELHPRLQAYSRRWDKVE
jgi:hypothetical protein